MCANWALALLVFEASGTTLDGEADAIKGVSSAAEALGIADISKDAQFQIHSQSGGTGWSHRSGVDVAYSSLSVSLPVLSFEKVVLEAGAGVPLSPSQRILL